MKNLISVITIALILILCAFINADAQTKPARKYQVKTTIVQAGGKVLKLDAYQISYVLSQTSDTSVHRLLISGTQVIKNNEAADLIIAIWRAKK